MRDAMSQKNFVDPITGRGQYKLHGKAKRPSIFYITADMVPPDVYGSGEYSQYLETPNLDKLIGDGVFFENVFCNSLLCGPSRASYITGRYPYITANEERAHDGSATRLRYEETIFPEYLRRSGYTTRHIGKCHVGPKKFIDAFGENDNPWNRWASPIYDDLKGGEKRISFLKQAGMWHPIRRYHSSKNLRRRIICIPIISPPNMMNCTILMTRNTRISLLTPSISKSKRR